MILADTSVWIEHLRKGDPVLVRRLAASQVITHPFIVGEIALGYLKDRASILSSLVDLQSAVVASDDEALAFIEAKQLAGSGIGYIDAHLLVSVSLTMGARLWTRDRKLAGVAVRLGLAG